MKDRIGLAATLEDQLLRNGFARQRLADDGRPFGDQPGLGEAALAQGGGGEVGQAGPDGQ